MATERLQVILQLLTGQYKTQAAAAATATAAVGTAARTTTAATVGMGTKMKGLAASAGPLLAVVGGAALVKGAIGGTVGAFASFDDAMTQSLAIMGNVSTEMRGKMSDAAREVAKTTIFSADQAAESYFFLASAGLDAAASVEAMPAVARFAQAGMFDMALATDLATDAQSALGLASDNANTNLTNLVRVTDVFVKANTLANTSVQQISEAMTNKAGAALRALGKDVEEGSAVLAAFADQGVKGAEAGTQFAIVLRDLQTKALQNKDAFAAAGVAVFDASGEMRNIADIISDLEVALTGMSDAEKKSTLLNLGFSDKSVAALTTLLGTSDAIRGYEDALRSAGGATEEVANNQLQSAVKEWELFKSVLAEIGLELGERMLPEITAVVREMRLFIGGADEFDKIAARAGGSADSAEALAVALSKVNEHSVDMTATGKNIDDVYRDLIDTWDGSRDELQKLRDGLGFLTEAGHLTSDQAEILANILDDKLAAGLRQAAESGELTDKALLRANRALTETGNAAGGAGDGLGDFGDGADAATTAADAAATAASNLTTNLETVRQKAVVVQKDYLDALNEMHGVSERSWTEMAGDVDGYLDGFQEVPKKAGITLDKWAQNFQEQVTLQEGFWSNILALQEMGLHDLANEFIQQGPTAAQAAKDAVADPIQAAIYDSMVGGAEDGLLALTNQIHNYEPPVITFELSVPELEFITGQTGVTSRQTGSNTYTGPLRHSGGPVEAGRAYNWRPGEEMLIPKQDSLVTSKGDTDRILAALSGFGGSGSTRFDVNVNGVTDLNKLATEVADAASWQMRTGGV